MRRRKVITLWGLIALLLLLLPPSTGSGQRPAAAPATSARQDARDKIEALVLEEIALQGQTDYFIWLTEKADLSPADQLQTKEEKGRFVYETLVATAERTQAPLRAYLDAQGVDYQAFYIANKVLVRGGSEGLLLDIAARPDVAQVTANHQYQLDEPVENPAPDQSPDDVEPNISFVHADLVWALGISGTGTVLAGNDSGIDISHPAIARHYRGCLDPPDCTVWEHNYNWWDTTGTYPTAPNDGQGHGTWTTGFMVGDDGGVNQIGMAPGAQTIHCKTYTDYAVTSEAFYLECLQWDLAPWDLNGLNPRPDLAPDAVNNSFGFFGPGAPTFKEEIQALLAAGILVEASVGNRGPACGTAKLSPANHHEVLSTGMVDDDFAFPGQLHDWSSRGPSDLDPSPPYYFPTVVAPGASVCSSWPGEAYLCGTGTSASGPHVTGLAGLILSACPNLKGMPWTIRQIIEDTAVPLTGQGGSNCGGDYDQGPNNDWGHGTIDALAAVQLTLALCGDIGSLDGHVYDIASGLPLEGAAVSGDREEGGFWWGSTDASGYYTLTTLAGSYTVTAGAYGYYSASVSGVDVITDLVTTQDFNLTAKPTFLISGTVTEASSGAPLSATVRVLDTPLPAVQTDPATGWYSITVAAGRYTLRAESLGYYWDQRLVVVDQDQVQDFALQPLPCILLVEDTRIYYFEPLHLYTTALEYLGYSYDVFPTGLANENGPSFAQMKAYDMLIWFSGDKQLDYYVPGPNEVDEVNLARYLDEGGTLFLSSQDYLDAMGLTPFGQNYLGISGYLNNVWRIDPVGTPGDPIGGGLGPFTLTPPPGWQGFRTDNVDGVQSSPFLWQGTGQNNSSSYISDTFRTVFFGWPLEGIADLDDRGEVLWRVIDWLGGCGCYQPVEGVDFSWAPLTPTVSLPVIFTGTASPWTATTPISFSWAFGDGTVGTAGSPLLFREGVRLPSAGWGGSVITHTYAAAGTYSVTLTATNCGASVTAAHTLTVVQQPCQPVTGVEIAGLAALGVGETGLYTATYTPLTATEPVTLTWDNGSVGPTAIYSWTMPGVYMIAATAANPCGEASGASTVTVCDPLAILSVSTAISGCLVDFSAALTGSVPFAYDWDFGPFGSSSAPTPTVDFFSDGTYPYTLTALNCAGAYSATFASEVSVACGVTCARVTDTQFSWMPLTPTVGQTVPFTAGAAGTPPIVFDWAFGDGTSGMGILVTHTYAMAGSYSVTLTATNCVTGSQTVVHIVTVAPMPLQEYWIYLPLVLRGY